MLQMGFGVLMFDDLFKFFLANMNVINFLSGGVHGLFAISKPNL